MKLSRTVKFHPALFGLIPIINVLFLVVLFFSVSSRFLLQPGIAITLPFSTWTLGPQKNPQILTITGGSSPAIFFRDRRWEVDQIGQALASPDMKDHTLIVKADSSTPYALVMRVVNEGLRAGLPVVLATAPERS
ncbi:MAG: biopolymer transporter ExbD [Chthoniobacteraceae bacterium]|jgi:biopolymer transport protein ExbD